MACWVVRATARSASCASRQIAISLFWACKAAARFLLAIARALFLQAGADARFEQSRLERLGQVILRAHPDAAHDRVQLAQSRNHDDRNVAQGFIGLEALEHFVAIHFRHHDVEQHEVEGVRAQHFQRLSPVFGGGDRVALTLQPAREHVAVGFDVIHDEHESLRRADALRPRLLASAAASVLSSSTPLLGAAVAARVSGKWIG